MKSEPVSVIDGAAVLPCPFCGRQPEYRKRPSDVTPTAEFHILSCFCGTCSSRAWQSGNTAAELVQAWNTRTNIPIPG